MNLTNGYQRNAVVLAMVGFALTTEPALGQPAALAQPNLGADTFAQIQKQIKPQPGESRWMEVPWFLDLHEARQKAAAEGKPLFIYSSGGATGIGAC